MLRLNKITGVAIVATLVIANYAFASWGHADSSNSNSDQTNAAVAKSDSANATQGGTVPVAAMSGTGCPFMGGSIQNGSYSDGAEFAVTDSGPGHATNVFFPDTLPSQAQGSYQFTFCQTNPQLSQITVKATIGKSSCSYTFVANGYGGANITSDDAVRCEINPGNALAVH